jgi:hypothetical protein
MVYFILKYSTCKIKTCLKILGTMNMYKLGDLKVNSGHKKNLRMR